MNTRAIVAICTVMLGCGLNNVFLEYLVNLDKGSGHLITFLQFLYIAIHGFIFIAKFGTVKRQIPIKGYLVLVTLFYLTSVINNWAFNFHIPVPLHMIIRSGSLIANLVMGIIILKKRYKMSKYLSVVMISAGICICILYSSQSSAQDCSDCDKSLPKPLEPEIKPIESEPNETDAHYIFWQLVGIGLLTGCLFLSAGMGICQEKMYSAYGKHPFEVLYYTHLFSLPGFLLNAANIWEHATDPVTNSEIFQLPVVNLVLPLFWVFLILNVVTQYLCISSVYILTSECSSLTVTLVITLRKFLSLIFSIVYFNNPFTMAHWFGTGLVFVGTLVFTEVPERVIGSLKKVKTN